MRALRRLRQLVSIVSIVVYFLANGIPYADPNQIAQAAGSFTISGMVYVNGQPVWDGFGVKITGSRGTTLWATTSGGWYQFNGFSSGTYTLGHNHNCSSNTPASITISGSYRFDIQINCPKYNLGGYVNINGKPGWRGFGVKAVLSDGTTKWAIVDNDDGWYEFKGDNALIAGNYTIHHDHNCPSNTPVNTSVPVSNNRGPDIYIDCPTYTLNGFVYVNNVPAWKGFGVKATLSDGSTKWAVVENNDGWYEFRDSSRLIAGNYTIHHDYPCGSNTPLSIGIPAQNNRGPDVFIQCSTYNLHGYVYINGQPAHQGFGVKASINGWGTKWALVENDQGYYEFRGDNALMEADYLIDHNHPCASNVPTGIHIPAESEQGPNIYLDCPDAKHALYGYVYVNEKPAWEGFGIGAKRNGGGTIWALTDKNGRYEFNGDSILTEGEYNLYHNHDCPSNNNQSIWIPSEGDRGPDFFINCPKYTLNGYVYVNGKPAWIGFGVKASLSDGSTKWAIVENDQGWYEFRDDSALVEGDYTIHHDHPCDSDTPVNMYVPTINNRGPDVHLTCTEVKYKLNGYVYVNGNPAWRGFGVKAINKNGDAVWALVENDEGWYEFRDDSALVEGDYTIHHDHPCSSDTPVQIHIPAINNRGPDVKLDCPTPAKHSLSGQVFIDGKAPHRGFGVKAVRNGVTVWAIVNNDEGKYSFTDLEQGDYYIGHNYPCSTNEGNPVPFQVDGRAGPNFHIVCVPQETPKPPVTIPSGCAANAAFVTKRFSLEPVPESILTTGPGFYITQKPFGDIEGVVCPENEAQFGFEGSEIGFRLTSGFGEFAINKNGSLVSSMDVGVGRASFECQGWEPSGFVQRSSCDLSYGFDARVPNTQFSMKGDVGVRYTLYVYGEEQLLSLTNGISELTRSAVHVVIENPKETVVVVGTAIVTGVVLLLSRGYCIRFPSLCTNVIVPPVVAPAASTSSALPEDTLQTLKHVYGEAFVENATLGILEAKVDGNSVQVKASGLTPGGTALVLVTGESIIFPYETPLASQRVEIGDDGLLNESVEVNNTNQPLLVLVIDLSLLQGDFQEYILENKSDIAYHGSVALLYPESMSKNNLFLPSVKTK